MKKQDSRSLIARLIINIVVEKQKRGGYSLLESACSFNNIINWTHPLPAGAASSLLFEFTHLSLCMFLYLFMRERGLGDLCVQKLFPRLLVCCCSSLAFVQFVFVQLLSGAAPDADFIRGSLSHNCALRRENQRERRTPRRELKLKLIIFINKQAANSAPRTATAMLFSLPTLIKSYSHWNIKWPSAGT